MEQSIRKERYSNIEFLRIVSIVMIIMGHMIGQSQCFNGLSIKLQLCTSFMGSAPRIAVNIFLIIAVWFMVDREFNIEQILKIYSELFFYSVGITLIMIVCGQTTPTKDLFRGLFPLFGRPLWFASAYIFLLALSPYLKLALKLSPSKLFKLILLLFIVICFNSSLPDKQPGYVVDCLYFLFIYLFVGFYKKYINKYITKKISLIIGFLGILTYITLTMAKNLTFILKSPKTLVFMPFLADMGGV